MSQESKAYICRTCRHMVIRQTFGIENGRHETWWACTNPQEIHFFGLPEREKDWEYTDCAAEDPNLEPWPEPLLGMVMGQEWHITRDQFKTYMIEAIPAILIAASLIVGIWISLLSGVSSA